MGRTRGDYGDEGPPPPPSAAGSAYLQVTCLVQPPPGPRARGGTAAGPKMVPVAPAAVLGPRTAAAAASAVVPRATASAITVYPTHGDSTGTSGSTSFRAGGGGAGRGEGPSPPARRRLRLEEQAGERPLAPERSRRAVRSSPAHRGGGEEVA